ncbi:Modification methylase Eco57IB [Serratia quinivorans]|uniref:Eco57I restriction-modification methylase domain-containing protein n=1 Tax=Serratia quinivorans TaxID=137545 RepID=UPI002178305F|nr:N-6 DNA methylase [Serratia quinivorans]CAI1102049.1 Modification methylase Eco57IB [Serratia quinivorans]CAI1165398.1 Modification methylase Eco57IB [Serratia quinivorans]CAI1907295.1 Modification methylase Eco57IB [Serratia quinivorans]CAI2143424.1 Modification methylase Eco57IB [Serratia quinivorans]CAI2502145.1 Modification methylase Eco57IB [Serratia quinivorans]
MSKEFGVFYTPKFLIDFIIDKLPLDTVNNKNINVIEPSAGDGRFIDNLIDKASQTTINATLVEINNNSAKILNEKFINKEEIKIINSDFLYYKNDRKFDIVLGNPPYISKKHLTKNQIERCREILSSASIPSIADKNIWTSFIIRCTQMLEDNGVMALVLPFDLLQVKFGSHIQSYLIDNFSRIEIYTSNKLAFDKAEQDTIILLAFKKSKNKGLYVNELEFDENGKNKSKLLFQSEDECRELISRDENIKWSSLNLSDHELNFLIKLSGKLSNIGSYATSRPGIVTAANSFFIVPKSKIEEYSLHEYSVPIIQKSQFFQKKIIFNKSDFEKIVELKKPSYFIDLSTYIKNSSERVESYLKLGESQGINKRYKCLRRKHWYVVPTVSSGEGFFFKRCSGYPKIHKNNLDILTTDAAYNLTMKRGFNIDSLIYSFYNPLTLCFAELYGRYYGGGVLELVPNEFRKLPIPYKKISTKSFLTFSKRFKDKVNIDDILLSSGRSVLSNIVNEDDFNKIMGIYKKLIQRRLKN